MRNPLAFIATNNRKLMEKFQNIFNRYYSIRKMRFIPLIWIFFLILLSGCFVFDKIPGIEIKIDKTIKSIISEICIEDSSIYRDADTCQIIESGNNYFFSSEKDKVKFKLFFKDSTFFVTNVIDLSKEYDYVEIKKTGNNIIVEPIKESKTKKYFFIILYTYLIIWLTKIPISLALLELPQKIKFIIYWSKIQAIYLIIFVLLCVMLQEKIIILILLYYIFVGVADYIILWKKYEIDNKKIVLAVVLSNIIFFTIGQFLITIVMMIY